MSIPYRPMLKIVSLFCSLSFFALIHTALAGLSSRAPEADGGTVRRTILRSLGHQHNILQRRAHEGFSSSKHEQQLSREMGGLKKAYLPFKMASGTRLDEMVGAELVGFDPSTLFDVGDAIGDGGVVIGNISVDGEHVPVYAYTAQGSNNTMEVIGVGEIIVGNLSSSRKYIRTLTCAQVAAVANDAAEDPEAEVRICHFVQQHCAPHGGLVNYLELPYCVLRDVPHTGAVLLLAWLAILFVWLTAQVNFLIPALNTISDLCELRQSVAGVTFLAFGNGCADLFSMLAATLSGPYGMELAVGEVLGNGMFVFCAVQGIIALLSPFQMHGGEYVRDCLFYAISIFFTLVILADKQIDFYEGVACILIYICYVLTVLYFDHLLPLFGMEPIGKEEHQDDGEKAGGKDDQSNNSSGKTGGHSCNAQKRLIFYERLLDSSDSPFQLFLHFMWPFDEDIFSVPWYRLVLDLVSAPIVILLKLTVPIVDKELPNQGWIRPVLSLQMLFFPLMLIVFVLFQEGLPPELYQPSSLAIIFAVGLLLGLLLSFATLVTSSDSSPPPFHRYIGFVGFGASLVWIYVTAREIVNVILAFGVVFEFGSLILGVTILAIGIGMQDLVTCVGVAQAGLPAMAAGACVGCSLMNILLGLGLSGMMGTMIVESPYRLYMSVQLLCCLSFMLLSVLLAVALMALNKFVAGRIFGTSLVLLYVVFIATSVGIDMLGQSFADSDVSQQLHQMARNSILARQRG